MNTSGPITLEELDTQCILCGAWLVPAGWKPEAILRALRRVELELKRGPDDPGIYVVHAWCAEKAEKGSESTK